MNWLPLSVFERGLSMSITINSNAWLAANSCKSCLHYYYILSRTYSRNSCSIVRFIFLYGQWYLLRIESYICLPPGFLQFRLVRVIQNTCCRNLGRTFCTAPSMGTVRAKTHPFLIWTSIPVVWLSMMACDKASLPLARVCTFCTTTGRLSCSVPSILRWRTLGVDWHILYRSVCRIFAYT